MHAHFNNAIHPPAHPMNLDFDISSFTKKWINNRKEDAHVRSDFEVLLFIGKVFSSPRRRIYTSL